MVSATGTIVVCVAASFTFLFRRARIISFGRREPKIFASSSVPSRLSIALVKLSQQPAHHCYFGRLKPFASSLDEAVDKQTPTPPPPVFRSSDFNFTCCFVVCRRRADNYR
mmetsp:Transcript_20398/g.31451  ORF Transcript_20398/g.31451 Transcript_20398/m.31451 type:complete len:111 (+) Transcript_20398:516-848(+)